MISQRSSGWGRFGARTGTIAAGVFALVALALPAAALAAPTGSIAGTVTDAGTHSGIVGVEVCARRFGEPEEGPKCEVTGPGGAYLIEELKAGEYGVQFLPGDLAYLGAEEEVTVEGGPLTGVDAELTAAAVIAGNVTAAGEPVEEGKVCAWRLPEGKKGLCELTDENGEYQIKFATPGSFGVEFQAVGGFATQYFDHRRHWREADPVTAAVGAIRGGVDAVLEPGGEIKGSVLSVAGTPLPEILVCAIEAVAGEPETCDETGIFGQYALRPLATGSYKVGFSVELGREFFGEELFLGEKDGFLTRFYDERTTLAAASPIGLVAPGVVSGINARLVATATPAALIPSAPAISTAVRKFKRCGRGFKKMKTRGKQRCVKVHRHHHRKRHGAGR